MIEQSSNLLSNNPVANNTDPRSKSTFCITRPGRDPHDSKRNSVVLSQANNSTNLTMMTYDEHLFKQVAWNPPKKPGSQWQSISLNNYQQVRRGETQTKQKSAAKSTMLDKNRQAVM